MASKPWQTTDDLIAAVKRKIAVPISQVTFTESDIIAFLNEEMFIAQVPTVLSYHEEYFVYRVEVPFNGASSRYPMPDRTIGMKLRDLMYSDTNGNLYEMTRVDAEDKAFFQVNLGINAITHKYYLEGNDVVLTPSIVSNQIGTLLFYIYLRPNQLVKNNRAATCSSFTKNIQIVASALVDGDTIVINDITFTARTGIPSTNEFQIDPSSVVTASNLVAAINTNGVASASNGSPSTDTVGLTFETQNYTLNPNNLSAFLVSSNLTINFTSLPSTWLNEDTKITEDLFKENVLIDFLQTKPGHRIYKYDIKIPVGGINGTSVTFNNNDIPSTFTSGDYICLANESIIPQIPPDLHNLLAERACARILSALGDQAGLAATNAKIAEMEQRQGNLIDNRVDGSIQKINGRHSILRYQGVGARRRF